VVETGSKVWRVSWSIRRRLLAWASLLSSGQSSSITRSRCIRWLGSKASSSTRAAAFLKRHQPSSMVLGSTETEKAPSSRTRRTSGVPAPSGILRRSRSPFWFPPRLCQSFISRLNKEAISFQSLPCASFPLPISRLVSQLHNDRRTGGCQALGQENLTEKLPAANTRFSIVEGL
jgi:hypothetical protein